MDSATIVLFLLKTHMIQKNDTITHFSILVNTFLKKPPPPKKSFPSKKNGLFSSTEQRPLRLQATAWQRVLDLLEAAEAKTDDKRVGGV